MDIKSLLQIVAVARRGNFSRAAEDLHITQPALSRSIATVEEQFGVRLFERGRSGAKLTAVGTLAVAEAEEVIRKMKTFDHNLRLYGRGEAGKVSFGMGPLVSSMALPDLSTALLASRPQLRTHVLVKSADVLLAELMQDNIELLFCAAGQIGLTADIALRVVGHCELGMLVRRDHPLTLRPRVTMADVAAFPVLSSSELSSPGPLGRGAFVCDNYHILRETVRHSDGVWMTSPQFVGAEIAAGLLTEIKPTDNPRPRTAEIAMIHRADCRLSPAASAITDHVEALFRQLSP